jgi:FtsH-binding integral membrane protein
VPSPAPTASTSPDRLARFADSPAPRTSRLTVVALLIAAVGFVIQMVAGVTDTPTIPPGLVVILVAAGLVAFVSGRWMPLAGVVAGLFNLVASVVVDAVDRLMDPSPATGFIGAWLMHIGLIAACIVGTMATVRNAESLHATDG